MLVGGTQDPRLGEGAGLTADRVQLGKHFLVRLPRLAQYVAPFDIAGDPLSQEDQDGLIQETVCHHGLPVEPLVGGEGLVGGLRAPEELTAPRAAKFLCGFQVSVRCVHQRLVVGHDRSLRVCVCVCVCEEQDGSVDISGYITLYKKLKCIYACVYARAYACVCVCIRVSVCGCT